ncbi:COG1/VPS51 family protein [Sporobolomyces koalae]|uniref:COG1/VPS51 family protein n=1 Tax=Sporobolomyces koalae TaxID=500713 RepID=UPI0031724627
MSFSTPTPRQRPGPSAYSTPGSAASRPRAPHLAFSPLSHSGSVRSVSAQSVPSYQPSVASSSFPNTQATRYLSNASIAPSQLGSVATTANPGATRFRRGHVRSKGNAQPPGGVSSANPDLVDLMALEEPDVVFRMFGVRDVRKIEQRASDAANAKVAELRTMVGERYRDLLAAADSIVRMRGAADKLLDRLDTVESAVLTAGDAAHDQARVRRPSLVANPSDPADTRTLASAPTLSLTLHLFLNLSSLVHSFIEQHMFLTAARLENLGRIVWHELEHFSPNRSEENVLPIKSIKESFPIVTKHRESMRQLKPLIVKRATAELKSPDTPFITVADTLAALILLDHASLSSSLDIFLKARSEALEALLAAPRPSSSRPSSSSDPEPVREKIGKILDCVLKTVEAVDSIYISRTPMLPNLLERLEASENSRNSDVAASSDGQENSLEPILTVLPNYPTLIRHLPTSIISHRPILSSESVPLSSESVSPVLSRWLASSTNLLVAGIDNWITSLVQGDHSALTLATLRSSISSQLATAPPSSSAQAETLRSKLIELVESRLDQVYTLKLGKLVQELEPTLWSLLDRLSTPEATMELDSARFLFSIETPQVSPAPTKYATVPVSQSSSDPFASFMSKVGKRVAGRTPLVDTGLDQLEKGAAELRTDLQSWFDTSATTEPTMGEVELRRRYVSQVGTTLEGIVRVLDKVLAEEESKEDSSEFIPLLLQSEPALLIDNILTAATRTLFVGTFARQLSLSPSFTRDLLLGTPPSSGSMLQDWQTRLSDLQARAIRTWQEEAVQTAISKLRRGADTTYLERNSGTIPTGPSTFLLECLDSLLSSLHALPLHILHSEPSPATSLERAFSTAAFEVASEFLTMHREHSGGQDAKRQFAWDVACIEMIVQEDRTRWEQVRGKSAQLLSSDESFGREEIEQSVTTYLLRTQSIYSPLFPRPSPLPLSTPVDTKTHRSSVRLLALGAPPPATQSEFKSLIEVVQPGPRLGLLPTKG